MQEVSRISSDIVKEVPFEEVYVIVLKKPSGPLLSKTNGHFYMTAEEAERMLRLTYTEDIRSSFEVRAVYATFAPIFSLP